MYAAFECTFCKRLHQRHVARCAECNYPELREVMLEARAYCERFGRDGGEVCVPDSARYVRTEFDPLVEDGMTIGGCDVKIYSHEYHFRCAQCGYEQRTRR